MLNQKEEDTNCEYVMRDIIYITNDITERKNGGILLPLNTFVVIYKFSTKIDLQLRVLFPNEYNYI